jgi:phosphoglycerate dehydrogenase-like enzyme
MTPRVAVLDDFQDVARRYGPWEQLSDRVELTVFHDQLSADDELIARLEPFEIVVAMRERTAFTRARLERLPNLRLLVTTAIANASFDLAAARELGIVTCGTDWTPETTVEHTWALILSLTHRVCEDDRAMREGDWQRGVGVDVCGKTLGLLGLGRLGSRVAAIGQAFGMGVIAWSHNLDPARARNLGVEPVDQDALFARSDVLSIHLKLRERTRGIVGARELALMKASAYFVNTSRGPLVNEDALLATLREERLAGAALDVFSVEPLPADHPLRSAPRTILTPHVGFVSADCYRTYFRGVVEDIAAYLAGSPVRLLTPERPSLDQPAPAEAG